MPVPVRAELTLWNVVLGAPDPSALASFEPDWVKLRAADGGMQLAFQTETGHVPPAWPAGAADQQMQMHLDILVNDLDAALAHAVESGASVAQFQPQDDVRVCLDPAGHPFCLFI